MPLLVPIANFESKYQISSEGGIWNLRDNSWQTQTQNPNGYMKVLLCFNGTKEQHLVHRLVALHFLPNPYLHPQVNHRDGDKTHNVVSNLEWISRVGNAQHALQTGLRGGYMSLNDKLALVQRVLAGELIKDLAKETDRGEESLSGMLRRAAQQHGQGDAWVAEMKRRRVDVAIRNLESINA